MCRSFRLLEATLFFILPCAVLPAADWPTFRGPQRTAVSPDTGLLQSWPTEGPPLVWETPGAGRAYSSLAIAGGRIYTLGDAPSTAEDKDEYLLCFSQADGKPLWKAKVGPAWTSDSFDHQSARSTPTVAGELVYALTPQSDLVCCEAATGAERWRKNLKRDFGGKKADGWAYSESVLIDGEQLVCTPGGTQTTMVALNKQSGDLLWKCVRENDRGAGHSSIVIAEIGGTKVYVQTTGSGALGVRAADGKLLWSYEIERTTAVIPTPILRGDLVFFTAGYGRGGALLKQVPVADGEIKVEEIYPINPKLANRHGGVVLIGEFLYADYDQAGQPSCADLLTGDVKWRTRGSGKGSAAIAAADGCLYIRFTNGTMVLAKADPAEYKETGSFKIPGSGERSSWSHPVIVDGKLYLREDDRILCYDVKAK